jgi:Ca-activated chloride channel family protein
MTFAYPLVLILLLLPGVLLGWVWLRAGRRVVLPFDHGRPGRGRGWFMLIGVAESAPPLLLGIVVILLAGPQRWGEPRTKRSLTNIELCVDVSGSMVATFGDGTRYDTSMKSIDEFLTYRKGDAFGLTFFGHTYLHWVPLTSDVSAIRCAPPFMRPEVAPPWMGGTQIGLALRGCLKVLTQREEGDRMIILISDGASADLHSGNDLEIGRELRRANIVLYHIHISPEPVPEEIHNVVGVTGGEVFHPGDPEALKAVFRRIDQMQQTKLEKTLAEAMDDFPMWCLIGLGLLSVTSLCMFGVRYTPW